MENSNDWRNAQDASDGKNSWISDDTNENETSQFRSDAEDYETDANDSIFASASDREEEEEDEDDADSDADDSDDDDADAHASEWGDVDPQSGGFSTGNEPSAPGSAV